MFSHEGVRDFEILAQNLSSWKSRKHLSVCQRKSITQTRRMLWYNFVCWQLNLYSFLLTKSWFGTWIREHMRDVTAYIRLARKLIYLSITLSNCSNAIHVLLVHAQASNNSLGSRYQGYLISEKYLRTRDFASSWHWTYTYCMVQCELDRLSDHWQNFWSNFEVAHLLRNKEAPAVSLSSTEIEYRAIAFTLKEILWLFYLLKSLGYNLQLIFFYIATRSCHTYNWHSCFS